MKIRQIADTDTLLISFTDKENLETSGGSETSEILYALTSEMKGMRGTCWNGSAFSGTRIRKRRKL